MIAANRDGRVDAGALRQADGRLAPQHGRLVHLAQALLGPAAAVLRSAPSGELTVVGSEAELRERAVDCASTASQELHRPWIDGDRDRCTDVRRDRRARARGRRLLARRRHRPVLDARLAQRRARARGLRDGRRRRADEGRPARPRVLGEVVPGRLGLRDARADPPLVLLAALHERGARRAARRTSACSAYEKLQRRDRAPDAQELGQRDLVRRRRREDGRRRHALAVRRPGRRRRT